MILSSKVLQKFKELRHFSRKQNFWPEEAKNAPCLTKIAPRLYMAAARFSRADSLTPCFNEIASRLVFGRSAILLESFPTVAKTSRYKPNTYQPLQN